MSCKYSLPHFLLLPVSHRVRGRPSFVEISFYASVYTLFRLQSCSVVFTSFPEWCSNFLLHCVKLPWGTFLKFCESCAESVCVQCRYVCVCQYNPAGEYCVCACEFVQSASNVHFWDQKSICNRLQRLILCDYCRLAGVIIITAFSTFISFDIDSNRWVDARVW